MARRGYTLAIAGFLAVGAAAFGFGGASHEQHPSRFEAQAQAAERAALVNAEAAREVAYTNAVVFNETEAWDAAEWGNDLQSLADHYVPPDPNPPVVVRKNPQQPSNKGAVTRPSPQSSGACGGATNGADAFIGRESGDNPSAQNPSGAYGCYQIMPGTWSGSCSDLGPEQGSSSSTQAQCASRLPRSSWSASGPT